jgi:tetratricopeptide (TPR) repeat protein
VKFREYAARGVAGVYADLEPYRGSVRDGDTGLLYRSGPELLACLDRLADDPSLRHAIRARAHAHVAGQRCMAQHIGERLAFYRGLLAGPPRGGPLPPAVAAAAVRNGEHWQLRPQQAEAALLAATRGPATAAAAQALAGVLEQHPAYLAGLQHMGRLLNELKDPRAALPYLERARALDGGGARTLCEIGRAHFLLDDVGAARAALEEALTRQPLYYPGWQYLLRMLHLHPAADGAGWAERARRLFPACYPLGLAGAQLHTPGEAVALLRRLLDEHAPSFKVEERVAAAAAFGQAIGAAVRSAPGASEALALLERACAVFPESGRLAALLGEALYQAGRAEESHAWLARSLRLHRAARTTRDEPRADDSTLLCEQLAEHILRWAGESGPEA